METTLTKTRGVEPWLWALPAATLSPPALMGALDLPRLAGRLASGSFAWMFILVPLFAPVVGLSVSAYALHLLLCRQAAARRESTVAAPARSALCAAQPLAPLAPTLLAGAQP